MLDSKKDPLNEWLSSSTVVVVLLATLTFGLIYFVDSHNFTIARTENFVLDIEEQEGWTSSGNAIRQIVFLSCAALGVMSLLLGKGQTFRWSLPTVLVALYVMWAGASFTWSIESGVTMKRYILMLCCIIGVFGFSRFVKVKDVVLATVIVACGFLMLGVATELVFGKFRPWVGDYRFAGTLHPNIQAANLAIGCIAAYTMSRVKPEAKLLFYGFFVVLFLSLVSTKCRSATLTVPFVVMIIWFTAQPTKYIVAALLAVFWLVSSVVLICLVTSFNPITEYQEVLLLGRGEETGSSLTGRLPLWEDLTLYIKYKPWAGYGYSAFWTPRHINDIAVSQEWVISEAHSSYMEATLQLGIVGLLLMVGAVISTFFYAAITFRRTLQPEYLFLVGGVFFALVRGFTESGMSRPSGAFAYLILALAAHSWHVPTKLIDRNSSLDNDSDSPDQPPNLIDVSHG